MKLIIVAKIANSAKILKMEDILIPRKMFLLILCVDTKNIP